MYLAKKNIHVFSFKKKKKLKILQGAKAEEIKKRSDRNMKSCNNNFFSFSDFIFNINLFILIGG